LYLNTRVALLNTSINPWYFEGVAGTGIGGPHVGANYSLKPSILWVTKNVCSNVSVLFCSLAHVHHDAHFDFDECF
jgi:meiotically up-regulated gene 157 (Mug157) protein